MSEQETASFSAGYRQLEEELANGTPQPLTASPRGPVRKMMPLDKIDQMTSVFQPRVEGDDYASERHIETLMNAIMQEREHQLDPVTVWWSGKRWLVIDGHHRLNAHSRLRDKGKGPQCISVKTFRGTLLAAIEESTRLNSKDKLAISKDDKQTRAWQLVTMDGNLSVRRIATVCKVGKTSVSRMRAKQRELINDYGDDWLGAVEGMTWREVINIGVERDFNEEKQERIVKDWTKRLRKSFGRQATKQPELFDKALEAYSPRLHKDLARWLWRHYREEFEEEDDNDDF